MTSSPRVIFIRRLKYKATGTVGKSGHTMNPLPPVTLSVFFDILSYLPNQEVEHMDSTMPQTTDLAVEPAGFTLLEEQVEADQKDI